MDGVIAIEVESQKNRHWAGAAGGQMQHEFRGWLAPVVRHPDGHYFADCLACQSLPVAREKFKVEFGRSGGASAEHLRLKQTHEFRAAALGPVRGGGHRLAIGHDETMGERVGWDLGFVVVDSGRLRGRNTGDQQ